MFDETENSILKRFVVNVFAGVVFFVSIAVLMVANRVTSKNSLYFPSERPYLILDNPDNSDEIALLFVNQGLSSAVNDSVFITKVSLNIARFFGYKLKFGEYKLPGYVTLWDAIKTLSQSKEIVHKICIPEGFSVYRVVERINNNQFLQGKITKVPSEGSLMPDTYCFKYPATRQSIIDRAQKAMTDFLNAEWDKKSEDCFLANPQEVLTLASIIEKESSVDLETIAGMYLNRLEIDMKLQADPTTIYAMVRGKKFPRSLTYQDLKYDDPYNTYVYEGLPPGPISNPGKKAILAVLHPKKSEWLFLYFDKRYMSEPVYAKTYQEHRKNIARIRKTDVSKIK